MIKSELENVKKVGGGGITAKNSSIPAKNSSYPADFDKNCKNSQYLDNTKEKIKNAHITYNECTTKTMCAEKVGNIMSIENKNKYKTKNGNNKVSVPQVSHNESAINCACVTSVGCEQNHGEKKVSKHVCDNCEEFWRRNCEAGCANAIKPNDTKFNRDERAEAKVRNAFTAKLCLCLFAIVACVACALGFCFASLSESSESNVISAAAAFGGGTGTEADPYLISSFANLKSLATSCNGNTTYVDNYFKLTADITISGTDLSSWTPIGCDTTGNNTDNRYFSGIFDGDDHTITYQGAVNRSIGGKTIYWGLLFGYVKGNATSTVAATNGIVKNINIVLVGNETTTPDEFQMTFTGGALLIGGIVGRSNAGVVDNCNLSGSAMSVTFSSGNDNYVGGIVASASYVNSCKFYADFKAEGGVYCCGAICGNASTYMSTIQNCEVISKVNISKTDSGSDCLGIGVIGGFVEEDILNCYVKIKENSSISATGFNYARCGLIAGLASKKIDNCYVEADMASFVIVADDTYAGLLCGANGAAKVSNCLVNATIDTASVGNGFYFIANHGTTNNCVIIADIGTLTASSGPYLLAPSYATAYNCVVITKVGGVGTTYQISSSNAGTTADGMIYDATNGLYSVAWNSNSVLVNELKQTSTYTSGTANFAWNTAGGTTGGTAWSFAPTYGSETGVWFIAGQENDGFPLLKQFYVPSIISVTINVTTNLGGSTTGSGTTGSMGSASAGGTAGAVNKFILYKLDGLGNVVNQYVVESGSTIQFESTACDAFTIMINYKLYMVTTIDGENALQKTFTPSENKTINISITAPANVNNWIVI